MASCGKSTFIRPSRPSLKDNIMKLLAKEPTKTYVVASAKTFRKYARTLPLPSDTVLEIGASFGECTEILARSSSQVIAIEHSPELFTTLAANVEGFKNVVPVWHDARDIHGLLANHPRADVLFFDIGGDAPAHTAIYLLHLYMSAYRPRIAVVRNITLAGLLGEVQITEFPDKKGYEKYKTLPTQEQITAHYQNTESKSSRKFLERKAKRESRTATSERANHSHL